MQAMAEHDPAFSQLFTDLQAAALFSSRHIFVSHNLSKIMSLIDMDNNNYNVETVGLSDLVPIISNIFSDGRTNWGRIFFVYKFAQKYSETYPDQRINVRIIVSNIFKTTLLPWIIAWQSRGVHYRFSSLDLFVSLCFPWKR